MCHFWHIQMLWILFLHFPKAEIDQIDKIQSPKNCENISFRTVDSPKLISRKIWVTEKSWRFHNVNKQKYLFRYKQFSQNCENIDFVYFMRCKKSIKEIIFQPKLSKIQFWLILKGQFWRKLKIRLQTCLYLIFWKGTLVFCTFF